MHQLTSSEQYDLLVEAGSDFIIFKHSGHCSISGGACKEVYKAVEELSLENIYMLDVLNTGDLKHYVAEQTEIKHESPQVLIYIGGVYKYHADHGGVSRGWLYQCLKGWYDTRE